MNNIHTRCQGAFIGHAIASNYDPSISMAIDISESLLQNKKYDGSDILSRYFSLYHTQHCEIGEVTKHLYQVAMNKIQSTAHKTSLSRRDFFFDQPTIDEFVQGTDQKLGGYTAGCSPAQRSFPLALCPWIQDDELFELSQKEAKLTHYNPLAGQVAGIVNLICRSLLSGCTWHDAVRSAFATSRLHADVLDVASRYTRSSEPFVKTHIAYAPTVLNATLFYIIKSSTATEAIEMARAHDKYYCAPVVGILSGALWGLPVDMYQDRSSDPKFKTICEISSKLSEQWAGTPTNIHS